MTPQPTSAPLAPAPWPAPHFRPAEFRCRCGKCAGTMNRLFLLQLEQLRVACDFPLIIASGYRCPAYNSQVSSTGLTGPHTTGRAVDVTVSRHHAFTVLSEALRLGYFTGIGVNQRGSARFIHLDNLTEPEHAPRPTVWSY